MNKMEESKFFITGEEWLVHEDEGRARWKKWLKS